MCKHRFNIVPVPIENASFIDFSLFAISYYGSDMTIHRLHSFLHSSSGILFFQWYVCTELYED